MPERLLIKAWNRRYRPTAAVRASRAYGSDAAIAVTEASTVDFRI